MVACAHNNPKVAHVLLLHGADHEARNWDGNFPLHYACAHAGSSTELVQVLLAHGADPFIQHDTSKVTPQDYAIHVSETTLTEAAHASHTCGIDAAS